MHVQPVGLVITLEEHKGQAGWAMIWIVRRIDKPRFEHGYLAAAEHALRIGANTRFGIFLHQGREVFASTGRGAVRHDQMQIVIKMAEETIAFTAKVEIAE